MERERQRLTDSEPDDNFFTAKDLNLYYDSQHPNWYKRPDWFLAVGVPRLYENRDMRLSYVVWQEKVNPFIVVELLSPGTQKEDLGKSALKAGSPPSKWTVYEAVLRVPYYAVFDRYTDSLRVFKLHNKGYVELNLTDNRLWLPELKVGLGLWQGEYQRVDRQWLRWYDEAGNWFPTPSEQVIEERQRADLAEAELARLKALLQSKEIDLDQPEQSL